MSDRLPLRVPTREMPKFLKKLGILACAADAAASRREAGAVRQAETRAQQGCSAGAIPQTAPETP